MHTFIFGDIRKRLENKKKTNAEEFFLSSINYFFFIFTNKTQSLAFGAPLKFPIPEKELDMYLCASFT